MNVPGFSERFKANDLIDLLITLNSLSPEQRLKQFNKKNVDLFLDYSFRAFLHAKTFKENKNHTAHVKNQLKEYLRSHSFGDGRFAARDLVFYFSPEQPFFRFEASHEVHRRPTGLTSDKWYAESPENIRLVITRDSAKKYEDFLTNNRKSFEERKQAYERASTALSSPPHPKRAIDKMIRAKEKLWALTLLRDLEIAHISELHRHSSMAVFAYVSSSVHVDLMVHKSAADRFGLKQ